MNIKFLISRFIVKFGNNAARINELRKQGIRIGEGCEIYKNIVWGSEPYLISIGDHVRITDGVKFVTHDGGIWVIRHKYMVEDADYFGRIEIGNNVHIGFNTIIMPGVHIGNNVIIGCGAIVTKDIPDDSVAAGVPAKVIKTVNSYWETKKKVYVHTKFMDWQTKKEYILNIWMKQKYSKTSSIADS